MASHALTALPIELLVFVIDNLDRVEDIASLALTNRRLYSTANLHLYRRAVQRYDARPLAWAASRGLARTLRMSLAAGADANYEFREDLPADEWERATAVVARAAAAANRSGELWGMWDYGSRDTPRVKLSPDESAPDSDSRHEDAGTPSSSSTADQPGHGSSSTSDQDSVASSDEGGSQHSDATPATDPSTPFNEPRAVMRRYTAAHLAARGGHDEIIKILIWAGAGIDVSSECFCACTKLCGLLNALEHPEEDASIPRWSPLHVAICHSRTSTAKLLLSLKASPFMEVSTSCLNFDRHDDMSFGYGATALHHAAAMGLTDVVRYLLANKIQTDVDVQDENTLTPFYHAYANRCWNTTVPLLLEHGADINRQAKMYIPYSTITPLGEACRLGDFDAADRLIDLGANVQKGFFGTVQIQAGCLTPLHMCCMRSAQAVGEPKENGDDDDAKGRARMRTIEKLIARGARLDARDCFGSTPLMAAQHCSNTFALEALSLAGGDRDDGGVVDKDGATRKLKALPKPPPVVAGEPRK